MSYDPNHHEDLSELLSAYLDGEVTAEERVLVEQRLAESAEFRQLHDELKALRTKLEAAFRYKLNEDLAPIVLRRAEKSMLAMSALSDLAAASEDKKVSLSDRTAIKERAMRVARLLRWSIVAVAAAIAIMVFNPNREQQAPEIARNNDRSAVKEETASEIAAPDEPTSDRYAGQQRSSSTAEFDTRTHAPASQRATPADWYDSQLGERSRSLELRKSQSGDLSGAKKSGPDALNAFVEGGQHAKEDSLRQAAISNGIVVVRFDVSQSAAKSRAFEQLLADQKIAVVDGEQSIPTISSDTFGLNLESGVDRTPTSGEVNSESKDADKEGLRRGGKNAAAPVEEAQPERMFYKSKVSTESDQTQRSEVKSDYDGAKTSGEGSRPQSRLSTIDEALKPSKSPAAAEPLDGYLVEASPQQIQATLKSLEAKKDQFWSFKVAPPPAGDDRDTRGLGSIDNKPSADAKSSGDQPQSSSNKAIGEKDARQSTDDAQIFSDFTSDQPATEGLLLPKLSGDKVDQQRESEEYRGSQRKSEEGEAILGANAQRVRIELSQPVSTEFTDKEAKEKKLASPRLLSESATSRERLDTVPPAPSQTATEPAPADGEPLSQKTPAPGTPAARHSAAAGSFQSTTPAPLAQPQGGVAGKEPPMMRVLFLFRVVPPADESR